MSGRNLKELDNGGVRDLDKGGVRDLDKGGVRDLDKGGVRELFKERVPDLDKRPPGLIAPLLRFWHLLGNPPKRQRSDI